MKTLLYVFTFLVCCTLITISSCKKDNKCDGVDCGTQGTCNEDTGKCDCNDGWEGTLCDSEIITSVCDTLNCGEYGICNEETGECDCQEGWMGTLCDVQTMTCDTLNCGDNGTCNPDTKMCDCEDGWKGLLCDEVDLCFGIECVNGDCDPTTGLCVCEDGWKGELCDEADNCFGVECVNGDCNPDTGMCDCQEGWTGTLCEVELPDCSDIDCGPNATCIVDNGLPICFCNEDANGEPLFSGENCEDCIASGGPCPENSHCTLQGCECNEGYIVNPDGSGCILQEENGNGEMYWGEYLQTDELCSDTSIDPVVLIDYALVVISQNNGVDNELLFNNLAALNDDVIVTLKNDPTFFEIPVQTTTNGHYFEGLTVGKFNEVDNETLITVNYTLTPLGGIPDTCIMTLRKR